MENDLHEQSITHKLAEHLQNIIGDSWNVDCEYNKNKSAEEYIKKIIYAKYPNDKEIKTKVVKPDIVIHKRGENNNLLALEVKKSKGNNTYKDIDEIKLENYTNEECGLKYSYGAYVELWVGNEYEKDPIIDWYVNGEKRK